MVPRYNLRVQGGETAPDGEWVRWADIEKIRHLNAEMYQSYAREKDAEIRRLKDEIKALKSDPLGHFRV